MPILDPTGSSQEKRYELAPRRLRTLDGARLGLLDNSKLNAADLLAAVGELLKERYAIKSVMVRTKGRGFSYPVEDRIADEMAEQCDVVIAAIGD
jgi:RNA:NAD 2'-phosphotransferase (TPT1/KptA family)